MSENRIKGRRTTERKEKKNKTEERIQQRTGETETQGRKQIDLLLRQVKVKVSHYRPGWG